MYMYMLEMSAADVVHCTYVMCDVAADAGSPSSAEGLVPPLPAMVSGRRNVVGCSAQ